MIDKLDDLKEFLRNINISEINFVPYFYAKKEERPYLTDDLVREKIKDVDDILGFRKHFVRGKERY